jgi:hypothetical protein
MAASIDLGISEASIGLLTSKTRWFTVNTTHFDDENQLSPYCLPQSGVPIEYLSSANGWVAAAFVVVSENEDNSRCLIRIGDSEALSQVSLRSLGLPQ